MIETLINWDIQFFLWLNSFHSPFWDTVMYYISEKETWYPLYLLIIIYLFIQQRWKAFISLVFIAACVTMTDQGSVQLFKEVFQRLRPCHNPDINDMVHIVRDKCGGLYGFVSSHAANTFGVAFFLAFILKKRWFSISILFWATVVSYSRIYLGVHYPLDILGGAMLGAVVASILYLLYQFLYQKFGLNR